MDIYFTRHGESEANILHEFSNRGWKHGLTPKGIQQAQVLADQLEAIPFARIFTSPLKRAVETAAILASRLQVDYEITDALREFDTGMIEGKRDRASWRLWEIVMDNWNRLELYESRIPGGESFNDMQRRFFPFVEQICRQYSSSFGNLILIGHGALFYCMLPVLLKLNQSQAVSLEFPNTGYVLAEKVGNRLVCREWCGTRIQA